MANGDSCVLDDGHARWLCQGDVFSSVPLAYTSVTVEGFRSGYTDGPAVLATHDCVLDKRGRGILKIERVHFLPLLTTDGLDPGRLGELRKKSGELQPFEAMYLGEVAGFGESYVLMSNVAQVPATYFDLHAVPIHEGAEDQRACPQQRDTRIGRLADEAIPLLRRKWIAHWTRLDGTPVAD